MPGQPPQSGASSATEPQVAETPPPTQSSPAPSTTVEPLPPIRITGAEATSAPPSVVATAEANVAAFDTGDLAAASSAEQPKGLDVSGEAPLGIPAAGDVTIKAAEAESHTLYVAGEATAGTLVRIFANDELVGEALAAPDGTWLLEAEKEIPIGKVDLRAEAVPESGAPSAPVIEDSAPFMHYADGVVLEPVVAAVSDGRTILSDAALFPTPSYVIIRRGDNLWRIARRNYGRGIKYEAIYAANKDRIRNPHWIFPGQVFVVPTRDRSWETVEQ
jgi:nucleoid-associated protein YgaU